MNLSPLTLEELEVLRSIPTPAVANAIETFNLRPRTAGFMGPEIRQMFPSLPSMIGYAVTARVVAAHEPGPRGPASRADYWRYIEASSLGPRIAVVEDLDDPPAIGAFFGEVNANIHRALGCVGAITNGGIRDLDEVEALGFPIWAGSVLVSHGYVHLVDFGAPVRVGGLVVRPGDLLLADRHGVIQIPPEIAREIPEAVQRIEKREKAIVRYCQSPDFSADGLVDLMARL
ncbi:MAG: RraA family protein [Anaerolineae bacterium]|nr:RraA family protein [Anaerolineae bacterium]MDW8099282.1 RraA family protein [Anaerolineae bacterium]